MIISTLIKYTSKYSNKQLLRKINASIKDKCTTSGIELTDFIQTGSGIVLHAITKNKSPCCPYCGAPSHSVHDYRYRKLQCTGNPCKTTYKSKFIHMPEESTLFGQRES